MPLKIAAWPAAVAVATHGSTMVAIPVAASAAKVKEEEKDAFFSLFFRRR
jgi:hypothetical protein